MAYQPRDLREIFEKSDGHCYICNVKLELGRYGKRGHEGGWEVDHRRPLDDAGAHDLANWWPSCPPCNLAKGARDFFITGTTRAWRRFCAERRRWRRAVALVRT